MSLENNRSKRIFTWIKRIYMPLAIFFILYITWRSRNQLAVIIRNANAYYMVIAAFLWSSLHFLSSLFTYRVLRGVGASLSYGEALRVHVINLPARYLPGGIWHTVSKLADFHFGGVKKKQLATLVLLENLLAPGVTLSVGGVILSVLRFETRELLFYVVGALAGFLGLLAAPIILKARWFQSNTNLTLKKYLNGVAIICLFWVIASISFISYTRAFSAVFQSVSIIENSAAYLFSWGVGYIAIFAPQGVGVFETVAAGLLKSQFTLGGVISLLAGFRLLILLTDLVFWLGFRTLKGE